MFVEYYGFLLINLEIYQKFHFLDYDWASGKYSTWTESIWGEFSVRMFVKPSPAQENLTLSIGAVVLILSFGIVYFLNSRSHILFGNV